MKRGYRLTEPAAQDVDEILQYVARDSLDNALKVAEKLEEMFETIAVMPGIGHVRSELRDDTVRVIAVYSYLLIYDPSPKPIQILRVIHGARNLRRIPIRPK